MIKNLYFNPGAISMPLCTVGGTALPNTWMHFYGKKVQSDTISPAQNAQL